jgi:hypothetical protein
MMISVDLTKEQATALLTFLRLVGADAVACAMLSRGQTTNNDSIRRRAH